MDSSGNFDLSPPPPAYLEQEFDEKLLLASQQSLILQQKQTEREDVWEVWDEAKFDEAATNSKNLTLQGRTEGHKAQEMATTSSQCSKSGVNARTQPLRIHKKNMSGGNSSLPVGKPKPDWLADAEEGVSHASSSRSLPPLAVPAYTPNNHLEPSTAGLSPASTLPNPYTSQDWGSSSPVPTLPDPHDDYGEQEAHNLSDVPPALAGDSSPPPPFSNDVGGQQFGHHSEAMFTQASPACSVIVSPLPSSTRQSPSPAYPPNPDTNLNLEARSIPVSRQHRLPSPKLQNNSVAACLEPTQFPQSGLNVQSMPRASLPSQLIINPNPNSGPPYYTRTSILPPQTIHPPRVNVDLSTVYGKRSAVKVVHQAQPVQTFNAAAFYNSAVSAHLDSTSSNFGWNSADARRQSQQPAATASLSNFPRASHPIPKGHTHSPYAPLPQIVHNQRPISHNLRIQDPMIRSPTPTYPLSSATNPMPQMLTAAAAANESHYGNQSAMPYSTGRGQVTWTESFIS